MADALYPEIQPYRTHRINVDPPHELYVEECGAPDGVPALFLHGGPGGGAKPFQRRTFDPRRFRVVLFDQRGCGRSTPSAELDGNTTDKLIEDIETIRETLGIERWLVTGGSWGSLLSLAYAIAHPDRCLGLRLHGVFLGTPDETRFWYHGIGLFFPEAFAEFEGHVPPGERGDLLAAYHRRLIDPDPAVHMPAAQALRTFSARTQTLLPSAAHVHALTEPRAALEIARIFAHYCINGCFLPEGHILSGIETLRHLPCEIVQGRYDVVTPPRAAWRVRTAWPEANLTVVDLASHVATLEAPALSAALRAATDRLADRLTGRAALSIEDYLDPRAAGTPAVSDDGTLLAFVSDATGFAQLYTKDLTSDAPPRIRLSLPEMVGSVSFRPKSRDILFTTDVGGDERHQLNLIAEGEYAARRLTDAPGFVHLWGAFDRAGERFAFACNAGHPSDMALYVSPVAGGAARVVATGPGWRTARAFSPDGTKLLVEDDRLGMYDAELSLVDIEDGSARVLLPRDGAHVSGTAFIEDGARLLVATDRGDGYHGLGVIDVASGGFAWLSRPEGDVEIMAAPKGGGRLVACAINDRGYSRLVLHDLDGGGERDLPLPFAGRLTSVTFMPDGTALVVALAGFRRPAAVYRIDVATGEATALVEHPALAESATVEPSLVDIETFDGASVPAFVFEPRGELPTGGRPALVIVHGGPESQYTAHWRADVQYLVSRGIVVVAPNVRGSTGYGRDWQAADDVEKRMDSVRDLKAVRDWVATRDDVDSERLAVFGQSYGGFMTLAAITEYPEDWCVAAEFYGIADFRTLFATTGPWRRTLRAVEYGDPDSESGRALFDRISPIRRIDRVKAPLFIAHGGRDPRVAPNESEMVNAALFGRGHPVRLVRVEHEGHGFARLANRRVVYNEMMQFLEARLF
ncbi:prolyl aminopeptidase [Acuticoccus sediminis]|uniref:Proline iminopeptidase n=1 Tax=Acuticoccus sediminis TaxID=2184697 RepID=A0A8B2NXR2_9HYPH|nr:prolyl aminopeptidase [Acuticoccus sediminis]RAI02334.1 prolyl aminopeptidase [Acuticoccus sediminis]